MRFFTIAIPLALSVFVAASPVAIDNNKAVVAREASPVALEHAIEARQVPADPLAVLKGLKDVLDLQTQVITTNAFDANRVAGALRTVNAAFTEAIASLKAGGANPDVNAAGLGGLLQNILGGLLGGLLGGGKGGGLFGKRQAADATNALAEVLDKLNTLLRSIPFTTALSPVIQQLTAALTPLVLQLTAAVNSQNPGTVGGVQGILNAVAAILKGLTSGLKV